MGKIAVKRENTLPGEKGGAQTWTEDPVKPALLVHHCEQARSCGLLAPYLETEGVTVPRPESRLMWEQEDKL